MHRLLPLLFILFSGNSFCQSALKQFDGIWYCKAENRYMEIFPDATDSSRVTINEWTGVPQRKVAMNVDAYTAWLRGQKLIIPADDKEHRAPYCELSIKDGQLIYTCNGGMNVTDQFLNGDQYSTRLIFNRRINKKKQD
jgi:hypothetical protein